MFKNNQQVIQDFSIVPDISERLNTLVRLHFKQHKKVAFYASRLHVHPNYLNGFIKRKTGLTAKQIIQEAVLIESKALLIHTDLSIKQVAYELGFTDPNHFSSYFKKETGQCAIQFRKEVHHFKAGYSAYFVSIK